MSLSCSAPTYCISQLPFPSRMTTETISETSGPMDALCLRAKVSDQIIVQHLKTQTVVPLSSMTALAHIIHDGSSRNP